MSWSSENEVLRLFAFHALLVVGKTMLMSLVTVFYGLRWKSWAGERGAEAEKRAADLAISVERARKAQNNDVENVWAFVFVGLFYSLFASPDPTTARLLFSTFTVSRLLHSLIYIARVRQPARGLAFAVGYGATVTMLIQTLIALY